MIGDTSNDCLVQNHGCIPAFPVRVIKMENGNGKVVTGKITKLDPTEGWGFLASDKLKFTRIFFHWSALRGIHFDNLKVGMEVEFKAVDIPEKGWRAFNIHPVKKEKT